ncbi:hypothetical protein [Pleomorphomonas sp. NRK KF1]|uniref:hypothetical protein n=1 Tax=Pleomorphomonas sp. NRK KF1 TaxID=2943000 RepID=UPI002043DECC|nr:hypothetical protein [Pleomorphomonas sp. NRK KF1]MCM5555532.1 hypothetical protein [Pleomorphomonas sp. NRK KF1]
MSVSLTELIEARDGLAVIMSYCDDEEAALYVPIFERLEREVEAAQAKQDALGRARRLAARKRAEQAKLEAGGAGLGA